MTDHSLFTYSPCPTDLFQFLLKLYFMHDFDVLMISLCSFAHWNVIELSASLCGKCLRGLLGILAEGCYVSAQLAASVEWTGTKLRILRAVVVVVVVAQ